MTNLKKTYRLFYSILSGALIISANAWAQQTPEETLPIEQTMSLQDYLLMGILILVVLFIIYWLSSILRGLALRARHRDTLPDGQPSVDERLMSELAPMQVALLRGNIQGFYEKSRSTAIQIVTSRGLVDNPTKNSPTEPIIKRLKSIGVDPVFLDCFESIMTRCDNVLNGTEKPEEEDHKKLSEDLHSLIRMRPKASIKKTELTEKEEKPQDQDQDQT